MTHFVPSATIQDEVLSFLLSSPTPQQCIDFQASDMAQERLSTLLEANRQGILTAEDRAELDEASQLNHFILLLKAKAYQSLQIA